MIDLREADDGLTLTYRAEGSARSRITFAVIAGVAVFLYVVARQYGTGSAAFLAIAAIALAATAALIGVMWRSPVVTGVVTRFDLATRRIEVAISHEHGPAKTTSLGFDDVAELMLHQSISDGHRTEVLQLCPRHGPSIHIAELVQGEPWRDTLAEAAERIRAATGLPGPSSLNPLVSGLAYGMGIRRR